MILDYGLSVFAGGIRIHVVSYMESFIRYAQISFMMSNSPNGLYNVQAGILQAKATNSFHYKQKHQTE